MNDIQNAFSKVAGEIEDYAIISLDKNGVIKDWNKGAEKLKGYKPAEIIGKNFHLFYTAEDRQKKLPEKLIAKASKSGKASDEGWRMRKDGTMFWGSILITALHEESGELTGFLKITRDLTERKQAEEKLQQANENLELQVKQRTEKIIAHERQYRTALDNMLEGVQIHDFNWKYIYVNDAAISFSIYPREELIGYTLMEKYPGIEQTPLFEVFDRCMQQRVSGQLETEFVFPNGTKGDFQLSIQPCTDGLFILSVDITKRKKAEVALVKSNRLYAFISGINQSIVHIHDKQVLLDTACHVAVNTGQFNTAWIGLLNKRGALDLVSIQGGELAVKALSKYSGMDFTSALLSNTLTGKALASGKYSLINDMQDEDAHVVWKGEDSMRDIKSSIALPIKQQGQVAGIFCVTSTIKNYFDGTEISLLVEAAGDISFALEVMEKDTLRRKAEQNLLQNDARLNKAQAIAHLGHWEYDFSTGMTELSEETCRIYGINPGTPVTFDRWASYLHPDDAVFVMHLLEEQRKTLSPASFEHRIIRKDGTIRHIHAETMFEFDPSGKSIGLYGVAHDITEQKLAGEELSKSTSLFKLLAENMSDLVGLHNPLGEYIYASPSSEKILGYKPEELIGISPYHLMHPADIERISSGMHKKSLAGQMNLKEEVRYRHKNGTYIWLEATSIPIFDEEKTKVIKVQSVARDITERKKAEMEIHELNESLEQRVQERTAQLTEANKGLEAFSSAVSHDLRAPVRAINGFTHIIKEEFKHKMDPKEIELFGYIEENGNRMGLIIDDLLKLAKYGNEKLNLETVDMHHLVEGIWLNISRTTHHHASFDLHELPEVKADMSMMQQVVVNLLSNAIKYSSKKQQPVVSIWGEQSNNTVTYYIKDNGVGFDMKQYDRLFGAFQRFHSNREFEGTGVGLTLVKRIIEKHGGTVGANASVGEGATFYFTLPAV